MPAGAAPTASANVPKTVSRRRRRASAAGSTRSLMATYFDVRIALAGAADGGPADRYAN
jgi:hypothetical protein